ncbi:hypothetical protein UT300007_05850 [Clostridium sp. CTA-7]
MKPYDKTYIIDKIKEYNNAISLGKIGNFEIKSTDKEKDYIDGYMYNKHEKLNLSLLELYGPNNIWMKVSPLEIESSYMFIKYAKGIVGVVGLGLGYVVQELAKKKDVEKVVVYEKEKDIIDLYNLSFKNNSKIIIINEDAYKTKKESFDFFYVDIYEYKLTKKVVDDYIKFNEIHNINEYIFWGVEHFLLSCRYEEIVWVYIPETWMEMSKKIFVAFQDSNLLPYYRQLDEKLVSEILEEFKKVLE